MLKSFSEGFLLGLGAATPLGPINILIMNNALKSYKAGVALGLGAMSVDILYLFLILNGITGLIENHIFLRVVGTFGSLFLIYLAYSVYKNRASIIEAQTHNIHAKKLFKIYIKGFVLTLFNPMTIIFWFSIAGYVANSDLNIGLTILGTMSSIGLWITIMPYLIHRSKHKISQNASIYLNVFSSLVLFGFGISLFVHVISPPTT